MAARSWRQVALRGGINHNTGNHNMTIELLDLRTGKRSSDVSDEPNSCRTKVYSRLLRQIARFVKDTSETFTSIHVN